MTICACNYSNLLGPVLSCNPINKDMIKKKINNQVGVSSSLYTMNLSTVEINNCSKLNINNKVQKHDSYSRYLAQKKGKQMHQTSNILNAYSC